MEADLGKLFRKMRGLVRREESSGRMKSDEDIAADSRDSRIVDLKCGCRMEKLYGRMVTTKRCRKHKKEFDARNKERRERGKLELTM